MEKNQTVTMGKILLALVFSVIPLVKCYAQNTFDFNKPEGTYVITDYHNNKITLKLNKGASSGILMTKGSGTIIVNGKTLHGSWNRFDDDPYIAFNTYDNVRISYALPSGTAKTDQIVISADGRASYNSSQLMNDDHNWISVKKISSPSKGSTRRKTKR